MADLFVDGFKNKEKYKKVIISIEQHNNNVKTWMANNDNSQNEFYTLFDGYQIKFPYRVFFIDDNELYEELDEEEKIIYDCIFTRHCDGYIREKHIRNILSKDFDDNCMPYILRVAFEYVIEIVDLVYKELVNRNNELFHKFCINNIQIVKKNYQRMVSYWNYFYRDKCFRFENYIGRKLFKKCFCPNINFEKQ